MKLNGPDQDSGMSALLQIPARLGADPRDRAEFRALREELGKLNHPACPDVDWRRVERLCLELFQHNGVELPGACAFALARSHLYGLEGMLQGLVLLASLLEQWPCLWPPRRTERQSSLEGFFAQLPALLRRSACQAGSLPLLVHLEAELLHLHGRLEQLAPGPQPSLQALRQQVCGLRLRLPRDEPGALIAGCTLLRPPEPTLVRPVVILPAPRPTPVARRRGRWLAMALLVLLGGFGVQHWLAASGGAGAQHLARLFQAPVAPLHLDSLALFETDSAELKPGSAKVLVQALLGIQARPGWLIVITGHSDASGVAAHNRQLSLTRAEAVRDWMQRMGEIAGHCFAVQGLGASQPIASNASEAGRRANRRVDIHLVPQAGACGPPG